MNKINLTAPYTHRVTIRLNDRQYAFIAEMCDLIDATPSDYIRMSINAALIAYESDTKKPAIMSDNGGKVEATKAPAATTKRTPTRKKVVKKSANE